jgi:hypothetical protein
VENRRKNKLAVPAQDVGGQLLLTEEQLACCKASSGEKFGQHGCEGSGNGSSGGHGHGHRHVRGGGRGDTQTDSREKREVGGGSDGPSEKCCFRCGKPSHFAWECRLKKNDGLDPSSLGGGARSKKKKQGGSF